MSDVVITLDSSDEESITSEKPINMTEQLQRKYKELNVSVSVKTITSNAQKKGQVPNKTTVKGLASVLSNILPIKTSTIGNTQIRRTTVPPKPLKVNNPLNLPNVTVPPKPVPPKPVPPKPIKVINPQKILKINPMAHMSSRQANGKNVPPLKPYPGMMKANTLVHIPDQNLRHANLPIIVNSTSLSKNKPKNIKDQTLTTNNQLNINPNITIKRNGEVMSHSDVIFGNKRVGGILKEPPSKKPKPGMDKTVKSALDNAVRKIMGQYNFGEQNSTGAIPTVEIVDDDDYEEKTKSSSMEIPIEYEPDNSKENLQLDPLLVDSLPVEIGLDDELAIEFDQSDLKKVCTTDDLEDKDLIGSSVRSKRTEETQDNCDDYKSDVDSSNCLSKCDFYTPKKNKQQSTSVSEKLAEDLQNNVTTEVLTVEASPIDVKIMLSPDDKRRVDDFQRSRSKKRVVLKSMDAEPDKQREINDTYQRFINLCFKLDSSDDMKKIVDKKVKAYYLAVHPSFTESKSFGKFMEGKIKDINDNPGSLFLYIKDVVEELKVRRVKKKEGFSVFNETDKLAAKEIGENSANESSDGDADDEEDGVLKSKIKKLERAMRKLNKAIKRLREREVDCDDENSAYLLEDRYKVRLLKIYQKLCQLTGEKDEAQNKRSHTLKGLSRLTLCGGRFPKLISAVKTAASAKPHWFPDFVDVLKCVEHCAKEQGLNLKSEDLQREAREAFVEIGTLLQQKRRESDYEDFSCMLGSNVDPAEEDLQLAEALKKNREISKSKEMEVINEFVEKQHNLKLVPEDVPDAEANKSDGSEESSDEGDKNLDSTSTLKAQSDEDVTNEENNKDGVRSEVDTIVDNKSPSADEKIVEESATTNPTIENVDKQVESEADLKPKKTSECLKNDYDDDKSNSSLSLVDLISSDSRDSFNSGVEADTEDSKYNGRFNKLKRARSSSVMSGINLLDDDSLSLDSRRVSTEDNNVTVVENLMESGIQSDDNAVDEQINIATKIISTDDSSVTSVISSEVLTIDEDVQSADLVISSHFNDKESDPLLSLVLEGEGNAHYPDADCEETLVNDEDNEDATLVETTSVRAVEEISDDIVLEDSNV